MTCRRFRIYLSAPLSDGNTLPPDAIAMNADRAAQVGADLLKHGFAPLVPQLTAGHACLMEVPWDFWIEAGCAWITIADAVLRLSGESRGTEAEIAFAEQRGVPVFTTLGELIEWRDRQLVSEAV
jgi:hypothetical protein